MNLLKCHPFPVQAHFRQSLVLRLPKPLTLDTFNDTHAFVAIAMVQTEKLRPQGFPAWAGNDFFLAGYRVFVRYTNRAGKRLRGLYILESQTDRSKMEFLGNLMTHYNYTRIDVDQAFGEQEGAKTYTVSSDSEGFAVSVRYERPLRRRARFTARKSVCQLERSPSLCRPAALYLHVRRAEQSRTDRAGRPPKLDAPAGSGRKLYLALARKTWARRRCPRQRLRGRRHPVRLEERCIGALATAPER